MPARESLLKDTDSDGVEVGAEVMDSEGVTGEPSVLLVDEALPVVCGAELVCTGMVSVMTMELVSVEVD